MQRRHYHWFECPSYAGVLSHHYSVSLRFSRAAGSYSSQPKWKYGEKNGQKATTTNRSCTIILNKSKMIHHKVAEVLLYILETHSMKGHKLEDMFGCEYLCNGTIAGSSVFLMPVSWLSLVYL